MKYRQTMFRDGIRMLYILVIIVALFPIFWIFSLSFKLPQELFQFPPKILPKQPSVNNYTYVLLNSLIPRQFLNSVIIVLITATVALSIALFAAYGFSRYNFKYKYPLLIGLLSTQMIPGIVNLVPLFKIMAKLKLLDTLAGLILIYSAMNTPFAIWILKGFFDKIPHTLDEAALMDGCTQFQAFYKVILPLTAPGISAAGIFIMINAWNQFMLPLVIATSPSSQPVSVGLYFFQTSYGTQWNYVAAASVVIMLPMIIIFLCLQNQFVSGLTKGAVKG